MMHEILTTSPIATISSANRHQTASTVMRDTEQSNNNNKQIPSSLLDSFKQENLEQLSSELLNDKLRTLNKQTESYFLNGSSSNQASTSNLNYMNEFNANVYSKMNTNWRSTPPSSASSLSMNSTSSKTSSPTNNSSSSSSSNESNSEYFPHLPATFNENGNKDKASHSIFATIAAASNQSTNLNEQFNNNQSEKNNEFIAQYLPHQYRQSNLFQSMNASFKPSSNQTIQAKLMSEQIPAAYSSAYNYYTRPYTTGNTSDFLYNQFSFGTTMGNTVPTTQLPTNTSAESLFLNNNLLNNTANKTMKYDSAISSSCSSTTSSISTSSSILNHLSPINTFNLKGEYPETNIKLTTSSPTTQKKENNMALISNSYNPTSTSSSSSSSSFTASPSSISSNKILSPKQQQNNQDNSHLINNANSMSLVMPTSNANSTSSTYTNQSNQGESFEWMKPVKVQSNGKTRTKDKYRVVYSEPQRIELEKEFLYSKYITIKRKAELSQTLNLSERQIKIWFQNRRAKERKTNRKMRMENSARNSNDAKSNNQDLNDYSDEESDEHEEDDEVGEKYIYEEYENHDENSNDLSKIKSLDVAKANSKNSKTKDKKQTQKKATSTTNKVIMNENINNLSNNSNTGSNGEETADMNYYNHMYQPNSYLQHSTQLSTSSNPTFISSNATNSQPAQLAASTTFPSFINYQTGQTSYGQYSSLFNNQPIIDQSYTQNAYQTNPYSSYQSLQNSYSSSYPSNIDYNASFQPTQSQILAQHQTQHYQTSQPQLYGSSNTFNMIESNFNEADYMNSVNKQLITSSPLPSNTNNSSSLLVANVLSQFQSI